MNQKLSWGLFIAGGAMFLGMFGHELMQHSTWQSVVSPESVGEMLVEFAAAVTAVGGALGITLKQS